MHRDQDNNSDMYVSEPEVARFNSEMSTPNCHSVPPTIPIYYTEVELDAAIDDSERDFRFNGGVSHNEAMAYFRQLMQA